MPQSLPDPTPRFPSSDVQAALNVGSLVFLGAGAFGDTWTDHTRAFKVICAEAYPRERLERELAGLRRVSSAHVVELVDFHEVSLGGALRPVLTFEFIEGGDLDRKMRTAPLPSFEEARALLLGLLRGVQALHAADGTIHRDIKPQNIALRSEDWSRPVLLDLGLAKSVSESTFTHYPGLVGTPPYMSPEQLRCERALKASDLFSIGVTVRHALLGKHPFYASGLPATPDLALSKINAGPIELPPTCPPDLQECLDKLVAPEAYKRRSADVILRSLTEGAAND